MNLRDDAQRAGGWQAQAPSLVDVRRPFVDACLGREAGERRLDRLHRRGRRFGAAQRAQEIAAGELGEIGIAPAAADQFGEQQGIGVDAVEARRTVW